MAPLVRLLDSSMSLEKILNPELLEPKMHLTVPNGINKVSIIHIIKQMDVFCVRMRWELHILADVFMIQSHLSNWQICWDQTF